MPGAQSSPRNKNFASTSKNPLKNRNWKKLVSNIFRIILRLKIHAPKIGTQEPRAQYPTTLDPRSWTHVLIKNFNFRIQVASSHKNLLASGLLQYAFSFPYYFWETWISTEFQNKTFKSKKLLSNKCNNAKYPFIYFSLKKIARFFFSS